MGRQNTRDFVPPVQQEIGIPVLHRLPCQVAGQGCQFLAFVFPMDTVQMSYKSEAVQHCGGLPFDLDGGILVHCAIRWGVTDTAILRHLVAIQQSHNAAGPW